MGVLDSLTNAVSSVVDTVSSAISTPKSHKEIVRSFGITKMNQIVERPDTDATRGAVRKVPHLLRIVE